MQDVKKCQLASGDPVPDDQSHTEIQPNGQQKDYVVLTPEERAKGFVRPVRHAYRHAGAVGPRYPLSELDDDEIDRFREFGYVQYEAYPQDAGSSVIGRYWTQAQLDTIGQGCGTVTRISQAIAETYARDPKFYGGTFCCDCGRHFPVSEFVWEGTDERVGS